MQKKLGPKTGESTQICGESAQILVCLSTAHHIPHTEMIRTYTCVSQTTYSIAGWVVGVDEIISSVKEGWKGSLTTQLPLYSEVGSGSEYYQTSSISITDNRTADRCRQMK